jgi:hypothetical protein
MNEENYYVNKKNSKFHKYSDAGESFEPRDMLKAAIETNKAISTLTKTFKRESDMELFDVIDKKQTGAFIGAIFIQKLADESDYLSKNPSQTGHPDLVPTKFVDEDKDWDQKYWDQFPHGGVEVKTSCGNLKNGMTHILTINDSRVDHITGVVWKGHHNEINYLLGLYWDYIDSVPKIISAVFSNELVPDDFTNTVPKVGGGHTTNVCITKASASIKLGNGWVFCLKERKYSQLMAKRFSIEFGEQTQL